MPEVQTAMTQEALQKCLTEAMKHIDYTAEVLENKVYKVDQDLKKIFLVDNAQALLSKLLENLNSFSFILLDTQQQLHDIEQRTRYPLIHIQHYLHQIEEMAKRVVAVENTAANLSKNVADLQFAINQKISSDSLENIVARIVEQKLAASQGKV